MIEALRSIIGQPPAGWVCLEYITASVILCLTLFALVTLFKVFGGRR
jgi:hypothetical protein